MKSFLKWAGGKRRLIKVLDACLPPDFETQQNITYVEPFVGGGAMLFHMLDKYANIKRVIINDINKYLIEVYHAVKTNPNTIIKELKKLNDSYISLDSESRAKFYYNIRSEYNKRLIQGNINEIDTRRVSLFLFLNKTCFNGLYRVNRNGEFNVPHGRYVRPKIYDEDAIKKCSKLLKRVEILNGDFEGVLKYIKNDKRIFMYLDPPYRPIASGESMFTSYDSSGFGDEDQKRVKRVCDIIINQKGNIMVSNSDSISNGIPFFDKLFDKYNVKRLNATRFINPYNRRDSIAKEVLITNYKHNS